MPSSAARHSWWRARSWRPFPWLHVAHAHLNRFPSWRASPMDTVESLNPETPAGDLTGIRVLRTDLHGTVSVTVEERDARRNGEISGVGNTSRAHHDHRHASAATQRLRRALAGAPQGAAC